MITQFRAGKLYFCLHPTSDRPGLLILVLVLVCYAATQLVIQLQQARTGLQVVCRNEEAPKRPIESNSTPAMEFGQWGKQTYYRPAKEQIINSLINSSIN